MDGSQDVLKALLGDPRVALALAGAIATAAVGGVAYILRGVIAWVGAGLDRRREALIAFKRFRVEVQIASALLPKTNSADAEAHILAQVRDHAARGEPFRIFNVTLVEQEVKDRMRGILHQFDNGEMRVIEEYIYLSRFLDNFYGRLCGEEFSRLSTSRQEQTLRRYLDYARRQQELAPRVLAILESHPWAGASALDRLLGRVARSLGG